MNRLIPASIQKTLELWTGDKPDLSHVKIFGSTAMVHIQKCNRQKWDKKAEQHILVGYSETTRYRLYNPKTHKVITSRDVVIRRIIQK